MKISKKVMRQRCLDMWRWLRYNPGKDKVAYQMVELILTTWIIKEEE